jgi:hypothetical protein
MTEFRHFTGEYRAWFKISAAQLVHTHSFQGLQLDALEIRNLRPVENRLVETERAGDYLYFPIIRAKKKSSLARLFQSEAVDIVVVADESLAFSEDLEQVILRSHSGERKNAGSQIREARFGRISPDFIQMEGSISFSVPAEPLTVAASTVNPVIESPVPVVLNENPDGAINEIPNLDVNQIPVPMRTIPQQAGGCFMQLFSLAKWAIYMILFLAFLGWIGSWLKDSGSAERTDGGEGKVEADKPRLNPKQDTLAAMPWDYLTDHRIRWNDFIEHSFLARYSTSSKQFEDSRSMHPAFANPQVSEAMQYWNAVYTEFAHRDAPKLDSLLRYFQNEQKEKKLNPVQTAEMVVTFIQEIPYCLVHEGSCLEASKQAGFIGDYHRSGKICLPDIIGGVQSPYEFLHNLKGDCDTRSLLGFSILSQMGIPASVWVSEAYGHSVLGVGLGSGGSYYKMVGGIRHSAVELTAKGFRLGMISAEQGDMNNWEIALYKN